MNIKTLYIRAFSNGLDIADSYTYFTLKDYAWIRERTSNAFCQESAIDLRYIFLDITVAWSHGKVLELLSKRKEKHIIPNNIIYQ